MASAELVAAACRVVIRVSKLKDAVQRVPEGSGDLNMLLCDIYQAPFSTNPRIFAVCRYGEPSAICRWGSMGQFAMVNNDRNEEIPLVH